MVSNRSKRQNKSQYNVLKRNRHFPKHTDDRNEASRTRKSQ